MKIYVISSSSSKYWDALNDVVILAKTEKEALQMVSDKFEEWQKPLKIKSIELGSPKIIFENFDLG